MYSPWQRFLTVAFGSIFAFILFVNLLGWSGAYIDVASGSSGAFDGKYFSLMSIINFLRNGKNFTDGLTWNINNNGNTVSISFNEIIKPSFLVNGINALIRSGTLGIPQVIQQISSFALGKTDIFGLLKAILDFILTLAFFPLGALYGTICVLIYLLTYLLFFVSCGLVFFAGGYNVDILGGSIVGPTVYSEYESIMSEYPWSSIVDDWNSHWDLINICL